MPCSRAQAAKRSFVSVLRSLGRKYAVAGLSVDRDAADADLLNAFKRLVRKVGQGEGAHLN